MQEVEYIPPREGGKGMKLKFVGSFVSIGVGAFFAASLVSGANAVAAEESNQRYVSLEAMSELSSLSVYNPFSSTGVLPVAPNKKKYDQVLVGPAFKAKNSSGNFDYYRYVTFYDVEKKKERIYSLPIQHEDCSDKSELFASYSYSYSFSAAVTASASLEGLGLSSSFTRARTFSTGRNIRATGELIADHTPYFVKQTWVGKTYIQTFNSKTKKETFLKQGNAEQPEWWVKILFPVLAQSRYPMDFEAKDADWTFLVERTITGHCTSSN